MHTSHEFLCDSIQGIASGNKFHGKENEPEGLMCTVYYAFLFCMLFASLGTSGAQPRDIEFGGIPWGLRQTAGPVDPGPNTFSNAPDQVWVDEQGRAHLTLQKRGDVWVASEMMAKRDAGYGTYRFTVSGALNELDPNIVFGFFTWDKSPEAFNREIDIEISRWGDAGGPNGWFTVQPYDVPGNQHSFFLPGADAYTFEMRWEKDAVEYALFCGGNVCERWRYSGTVPEPGRARLRINLWLFHGRVPLGPGPYEVIVSDFSYSK
jgi:hypothetical protein